MSKRSIWDRVVDPDWQPSRKPKPGKPKVPKHVITADPLVRYHNNQIYYFARVHIAYGWPMEVRVAKRLFDELLEERGLRFIPPSITDDHGHFERVGKHRSQRRR